MSASEVDQVEAARLPALTRPAGCWWAWVGLHGGAGVTTLARAVPGGADFGRLPGEEGWPALPVVAVCRSHAGGLEAAQRWAAWAAEHGEVPVLGLVVTADAPGRLPRQLESMVRLISGGYPSLWRLPWVKAWRLGQPPTPANTPPAYRHLLKDLIVRADVPLNHVRNSGGH